MQIEQIEWDKTGKEKLSKHIVLSNRQKFVGRIPWKKDKLSEFVVYKVPIDVLSFNINNIRIKSELDAFLAEKNMKFNPKSGEQQNKVQQILLESMWFGDEQTERLKTDLEQRKQIDPAIARPDGVLIDGNRRLAIFKKFCKSIPDFNFMYVCILPDDSTERDLKELEIRLQLTQPFRVQYGSLNTALEFRNLYEKQGWTLDEIQSVTRDYYKKKKIHNMIKTVYLIDEYLEMIPPQGKYKQHYTAITKRWEIYYNLFSTLQWSTEKQNVDPETIKWRKIFGFHIIYLPDTTFADIRRFHHTLKEDESRKKLESSSKILSGGYLERALNKDLAEDELIKLKNAHVIYDEIHGGPLKMAQLALDRIEKITAVKELEQKKKIQKILRQILDRVTRLSQSMK